MANFNEISVEYADHTYRGHFRLAGDMLHVDGAYGATSALLNGPDSPELLAEMMLYGLAQSWGRTRRMPQALSA